MFDGKVRPTRLNLVLGTLVAVLLLVVAMLTIGSAVDPLALVTSLGPIAPVVAAVVAVLALLWTAVSTYRAAKRSKRQATVEAWIAWCLSTDPARRKLLEDLGSVPVSSDQARALVDSELTLRGRERDLEGEEKRQTRAAIRDVLNGLERLAVGVKLGVYDSKTLSELGGSIIVRNHARFQTYVAARREEPDMTRRQTRAYTALDSLVEDIRRHQQD